MSILRLEGVRRETGDVVILDSVSVGLARGDRIGLVGANGAGKTTLLEIAAGRLEPEAGSVHLARGTSVGLSTQEAHVDGQFMAAPSVRALVRSGAAAIERMERQLVELEGAGAAGVQSAAYAALRDRFEAADGYGLDQRVDHALTGLGIAQGRWDRRPTELSGGEQTRVALARLLTADPDLLLLDEPTNHLDIAAFEWLETVLARRRGSLIVASHDRAFLDNTVDRVWELRDHRLSIFRGGYSAYLLQRQSADARSRRLADSTAAAIVREEGLVQRYRSQRKHVKMHEHERRLEQLRDGQVPAPRRTLQLRLPNTSLAGGDAGRSAEVVVSLEGVICGYVAVNGAAPRPVVKVERLELRRGERIGIVGPNGAGKSTLLRTIAGQLPALGGFVRVGRNVLPGYLSQLRDRPLGGDTVVDALLAAAPVTPGDARSYLARFLFRGEDVQKPVRALSGGERSRLELALLGIGSVNLLLLDEPTNHLDIPAREALEAFLRESPATLVLVSHDRRRLESVGERLGVVEPGRAVTAGRAVPGSAVAAGSAERGCPEPGREADPAVVAPYEGGYREWRAAVADGWTATGELARRPGTTFLAQDRAAEASRRTATRAAAEPSGRAAGTARPVAVAGPVLPRLSKDAYRRERERIESDLTRLTQRKLVLEAGLGDPAVQANFVELRRLGSELADIDGAISLAEDAWLTLEERTPA
jgi:ATP-binding cassette subfamily F protein 3